MYNTNSFKNILQAPKLTFSTINIDICFKIKKLEVHMNELHSETRKIQLNIFWIFCLAYAGNNAGTWQDCGITWRYNCTLGQLFYEYFKFCTLEIFGMHFPEG
jgi:hypothetical protein